MTILSLSYFHRGFFSRMRVYLAEMYPLPARLITSAIFYVGFAGVLQRTQKWDAPIMSWTSLVGTVSIFLILLLLRLMDELKDKDVDARLFRDRPLPSGKVLESDIRMSMALVAGVYLALNMSVRSTFLVAAGVLGYALLMYRFFFIPQILKRSLLLTLATHNPIIPFMLAFLVVLTARNNGAGFRHIEWMNAALLVLQFWSMSFSWEIARKIRCQEEENEYVTYSKILGPWGAAALALGGQTISFVIGLHFAVTLSFSAAYVALLYFGYAILTIGYVRFFASPDPRTSRLRPFAEMFMIVVMLASIVESVLFNSIRGEL